VPGAARLSGLHHESVAAHVLQRLQPLGAHAITLAEALVVVGDGGSLRHAAALAELPTDDAELVADAIEQARVLMSRQPVRFVHPLVADAIGAQIPAGRRSVWHRRVARLLVEEGDTERAVSHLLEVTPAGETWVIDLLRAEARRALTTGDGRSAAAMLARALREPPPAADRGRLLADLGEAELAAGLPSCVAHLREARQLAADPVGIERSARLLATALGVHGPVKLAGVVLEEALEALGQDDARSARLQAELLTIAQASHPLAAQTKDQLEEAARAADGSSPADAMLLAALGYQQSLTWRVPAVSALENLAEAFDSDLIELAGCDSNAVVMGGTGLILTGAWDLADHVFGQIADQARSLGSSRGLAHSLVLRARLALARGAFDDAEVDAQVAAGITAPAYPMLLPFALAEIVLALSARGEAEAAATMLADQQLADGDLPPTTPGTFLIVARMSLRRRLGDIDAAAADLARLDEFVVDRGTYPRGWASEIVATLSACGRTEEALVVAGEHLDAAHRWGLPADIAEAMRSRAALCPTEALDLLRAAAEFVEHADVAWLRAPIYADLGAALRRANQRAQARPYLEEALDIAHRCGAIPLERHVRAELLASGARPRRLARTGVAALTPSERRIAQMATQGLSNSEIAQALFITRKTVEKHLGNCFVKLGISQRGDLGPLLAAVEDLSTPG
jgi:DNA-binding CsgD family transcriptional regulator